tara:strand:- start:33259 stop:33786 length:528 start_codon:yes stop_codon:yes gene_type:complete
VIFNLGSQKFKSEDENFYIAHNATVIGDVTLKKDASIWFGAILRGDTEPIIIGEGSNVQDGAVIHTDLGYPTTLGRDVTIGHQVMLHGCSIGDGTLIGINAVVLNGAKIGKGCLIGANSLVTEGMEVPDGSVVMGSPGKVRSSLDHNQKKGLLMSAHHYVENYKRFKSELVKLEE